jgi:UDP-N-acetylglucosamine 3-dehydrogenase
MTMSSAPIATLVVGYGNMGGKHARVLRELGGTGALWGVVDSRAERRERAGQDHGCRTFATIDDALAAPDRFACAVVAASTERHHDFAAALIGSGVPTLVEKPITATSAQGHALAALATTNGTLLTVGHTERFNPAVLALGRLLTEGALGELLELGFRRVGPPPVNMAAHGDALTDLAVHDLDLARFLTGAELTICAAAGHRTGGVIDGALVLGALASGAALQLQVNWCTPIRVRRIELTGTAAYAEVDLVGRRVRLYRPATPAGEEIEVARQDPLQEELRAFWAAIAARAPAPVPAADALRAVELAEAARALIA